MKFTFVLALLLAMPTAATAQQSPRTYFTSPLAQQRHLPFSSAVLVANTLYIAGTIGVDPGMKTRPDASQEARLVMNSVRRVTEQAGMTMDDVVSIQVFCTDLRDYAAFNNVYKTYFHMHYPSRAFLGASNLLFGARYEVMGIAIRR